MRNFRSLVAAMKTKPPSVTMEPPMLGAPVWGLTFLQLIELTQGGRASVYRLYRDPPRERTPRWLLARAIRIGEEFVFRARNAYGIADLRDA
jgi:hypothetical protein